MRRKVILRQPNRFLPLGACLALLGASTSVTMIAANSTDPAAWVISIIVGGGFVTLGVAMILKTLKEKVTVYQVGLTKDSAPYGERTFQCNWDKVMDYSWTSKTRVMEIGADSTTYILTSQKAQLRINTNDSYFPILHSYILSRVPENAHINLQKSETPNAIPVKNTSYFRRGSKFGNAGQVLALFLLTVAGAFCVVTPWLSILTTPAPISIKIIAGIMGAIFLYVGGSGMANAFRRSGSDSLRVSSDGVTAYWGGKRGQCIKWEEMRAVQFLYSIDTHTDDNDSETISIRVRSPISYYYAIIGAEGKCIWFNSNMPHFIEFRNALVDHAHLQTAISFH